MHPIIAKLQSKDLKKVPEVKTGFTVRVSQRVTEGAKERIQNFEGLVIKVGHGAGVEKTFTVRKIVEGIGVEKVFPFHSPTITKIHVVKKAKVRREKLYYMRDRFGKSARLSEKQVTDEERAAEEVKMEALYAEAVKEQEKAEKEGVKAEKVEVITQDEAPEMKQEAQEAQEEAVAEVKPESEPAMAEVQPEEAKVEEETEEKKG